MVFSPDCPTGNYSKIGYIVTVINRSVASHFSLPEIFTQSPIFITSVKLAVVVKSVAKVSH